MKEAYEQVKAMRGLSVRKDLYTASGAAKMDENFTSSRPNSEQYSENFDDFDKSWEGQDRREFFSKLNREQYRRLRESMENIEEIKDIKFNVIDAETPDTDKRWGFEKEKAQIRKYGPNSNTVYLMIGTILAILGGIAWDYQKPSLFSIDCWKKHWSNQRAE